VLAVVSVADISYGGDVLNFVVLFNTTPAFPISDASGADAAKWTARYAGSRFIGVSLLNVDYNAVEVGLSLTEAEAGADEFGYSNAPSDISDALGRQLAAFGGFPL
jgi:hypothetical protein